MMKRRESERRSAEDVAREMVLADEYSGWIEKDGAHVVTLRCPADAAPMQACIARTITRAREEGAAAALESIAADFDAQEMNAVSASSMVAWKMAAKHARSIAFGAAAERARQQPSDLAGRIRALVQEKAGEWADTDSAAQDEALHDVMEHLVHTAAAVRRGVPITKCIDGIRSAAASVAWGALLIEVADELEAIACECAQETKR